MTAEPHILNSVAAAVIAEDRVPADTLVDLIEAHGGDHHKDAVGLDREEEHDPRACPTCGGDDFQEVDWAPVGYGGKWNEAGEWENDGHGGEVFWDGGRAEGIECRNCVTTVKWDAEAGRLVVDPAPSIFVEGIAEDLRNLLDYVQPDEERDHVENEGAEHIVHTIRRLRAAVPEPQKPAEPVANG